VRACQTPEAYQGPGRVNTERLAVSVTSTDGQHRSEHVQQNTNNPRARGSRLLGRETEQTFLNVRCLGRALHARNGDVPKQHKRRSVDNGRSKRNLAVSGSQIDSEMNVIGTLRRHPCLEDSSAVDDGLYGMECPSSMKHNLASSCTVDTSNSFRWISCTDADVAETPRYGRLWTVRM
jgi:hypothetical protein